MDACGFCSAQVGPGSGPEAAVPSELRLQSFWSPGSSVQPAPGVSPGVWEEEEESLQEEQHQELPEVGVAEGPEASCTHRGE